MTYEERVAYLELTLRKSPEGSARRLWAAAQLKELGAKRPVADGETGNGRSAAGAGGRSKGRKA